MNRPWSGGDFGGARTTIGDYRRFARDEAAGRSPSYEQLACAVADDDLILSFLAQLPVAKRQPNLLFASARYVLGTPPDPGSLRSLIAERPDELSKVMLLRRTQTNEPARCAVLLPALAVLAQPLAIVEVGAAAGLTLLPDVYSYDYDGHRLVGSDPEAPTLLCHATGPIPLPVHRPQIIWRAGIDLNPLDVYDDQDVAWLSCLVWPGEADRSERLHGAIRAARRQPPLIYQGDLVDDLHRVAAQAPAEATLVVYHSAVLPYVDVAKRKAFAAAVGELNAVWLSNEAAGVLPDIPAGRDPTGFLLVHDGTEVLACTDPHGAWLEWMA